MGRRKKPESLNNAIKTIQKAAEAIEETNLGDNGFISMDPSEIDPAELEIQELFDTLPNANDFYLKVYKRKPLPLSEKGPQFKTEIIDVSSIQDLEITVRDLAKDNNWGPGEYEVQALRKSESPLGGRPRRMARPAIIQISYDQGEKNEKPQTSFNDELDRFLEFDKKINRSQGSSSELTKALADTFNTSIETVTKLISPSNGHNYQAMTIEIIKSLKDLGIVGKETNKPITIEDIIKLIPIAVTAISSLCKETGIFKPRSEKDILVEIGKLRESGIIRFSGDTQSDPIDSVSKVVDIIAALNPLIDRNESGSIGVELIRTIGPSVPKMVEDVTGTIREVAEVARLKLARQMNIPPEQLKPRIPEKETLPPVHKTTEMPPQTTISENQMNHSQETKMRHPVIQKILDAIEQDNKAFYPDLKQNILMFVGGHAIEGLISGELTTEAFLTTMSETLKEPEINTEKARVYLDGFVQWIRDEIEKDTVAARCNKCGKEYEMSSEEWEADSKICSDDCDGNLEKIKD